MSTQELPEHMRVPNVAKDRGAVAIQNFCGGEWQEFAGGAGVAGLVIAAALDLDGSRTGEDAVTRMAKAIEARYGGTLSGGLSESAYRHLAEAALSALLGDDDR